MLRLWDPVTGKLRASMRGHTDGITAIAIAPDGRQLGTSGNDKTIKLWPAAETPVISRITLHGGYKAGAFFAVYSPDGKQLLTGGDGNNAHLWNPGIGLAAVAVPDNMAGVYGVDYSPDGKTLATTSNDATVKLWDLASGRLKATLMGHSQNPFVVAFSPDGKLLASGTGNHSEVKRPGEIKLWNAETGENVASFDGHQGMVYSLRFSLDGKTLYSSSNDNTIKRLGRGEAGDCRATLTSHKGRVRFLALTPDGKLLASASHDKTVSFWDTKTDKVVFTLDMEMEMSSIAISPDGNYLAASQIVATPKNVRPGIVKLFDLKTRTQLRVFEGHGGWILSLVFTPDGKTLIAGGGGQTQQYGEISLYDVATGQLRVSLSGHQGVPQLIALSPDGRRLANLLAAQEHQRSWGDAPVLGHRLSADSTHVGRPQANRGLRRLRAGRQDAGHRRLGQDHQVLGPGHGKGTGHAHRTSGVCPRASILTRWRYAGQR